MKAVQSTLKKAAKVMLPRVLTQICRDPSSPLYGCCDRNWWHYKIPDFPSIILQQAGLTVALYADVEMEGADGGALQTLAAQTCRFWNTRAIRHGAFEEYYPNENGYPPLAFSTLAVAHLCRQGVIAPSEIHEGLVNATRQLTTRFEQQASNQQIAGTAALAMIHGSVPDFISDEDLKRVVNLTLDLQTGEGWFPEYDGPDLGYLSVSLDCLWDIYDMTNDSRVLSSIESAFDFMAWFVLGPLGKAGMLNSRNTDYIVPYGISRIASGGATGAEKAKAVLHKLFGEAVGGHWLFAIDDRYWCHYIGHSFLRALIALSNLKCPGGKTWIQREYGVSPSRHPVSGYTFIRDTHRLSAEAVVAARKGGVFTAVWPSGQRVSDYGWIIQTGKDQFVTHWWSLEWRMTAEKRIVECEGKLFHHREQISTPWKHLLLRAAGFMLGSTLIGILKKKMIYKENRSPYFFKRRVECIGESIIVKDRISGLKQKDQLLEAPRASKRHVASADSYNREDFVLRRDVVYSREIHRQGDEASVTTQYVPGKE